VLEVAQGGAGALKIRSPKEAEALRRPFVSGAKHVQLLREGVVHHVHTGRWLAPVRFVGWRAQEDAPFLWESPPAPWRRRRWLEIARHETSRRPHRDMAGGHDLGTRGADVSRGMGRYPPGPSASM
jgi:hypothetical protein